MSDQNLVPEIQAMAENGKNRGQIEGWLKYMHDMSNKEAKTLLEEALGKTSASTADWEATIRYIRENYGRLSKADLVEGMMEVKGAKESSMVHAYTYIKFAQEYARQEVEAALEAQDA